jgi:predicted RNA-binding Zn-ribbon protein involved in translation (DUF1610 family)
MQKVSCPSCGAEVTFRSAASVMAVCEYCQATLLKDADSVKNIGKMSEVVEDFSPLQITTSGVYQGRNFALVGRIQLRYDASGQYVFTIDEELAGDNPAFESIRPGMPLRHRGATFYASDVRTAQCVGGEGELPIRVGNGWQAKVADFRGGHRFLTLDYSDGVKPQLYAGQAVTLEGMRCQLLRADDGVEQTANRYRGKLQALECPSCGSSIKYVKGMASHLLCPSCHAQVDCSTDKVQVLRKADELQEIATSVALGDVATINGSKYEVIGLMQCGTTYNSESWTWVEYLLFNPNKGFTWLVESGEGWDSVAVLNEWPVLGGGSVSVSGDSYAKSDEYEAHVLYAAGAFNWRVAVGDRTHVIEYKRGGRTLTSEANANEIVWSAGRRVQPAQIAQWFGRKPEGALAAADETSSGNNVPTKAAWIFTILLAVMNLPISLASGFAGIQITLAALAVLWLPVLIMRYFGKDSHV